MLSPDPTMPELALPPLDPRLLLRRLRVPVLLVAGLAAFLLLGLGHVSAVGDALHRVTRINGYWTAFALALESLSLAGYVVLLSFVAGRATQRIGIAQSAQITLAGAAATRLLPTAGAGGAAMTLWSLRRAGLRSASAARTLLSFLVVLYSVFLTSIVLAGAALSLGLERSRGPLALSAIPAAAAAAAIAVALGLAFRRRATQPARPAPRGRLGHATQLLGAAVRDACRLAASGDVRLAGAVIYWAFDAAVLWAMLNAFGAHPPLAVIGLAYFVGQVANTLPLPGSVSGGVAGVLVAFAVAPSVALPAVLAYRTIAVWLPVPVAVGALSRLRRTVARWSEEDAVEDHDAAPYEHDDPIRLHGRADRLGRVAAA